MPLYAQSNKLRFDNQINSRTPSVCYLLECCLEGRFSSMRKKSSRNGLRTSSVNGPGKGEVFRPAFRGTEFLSFLPLPLWDKGIWAARENTWPLRNVHVFLRGLFHHSLACTFIFSILTFFHIPHAHKKKNRDLRIPT